MSEHRIFGTPFAEVYRLYLAKIERKGQRVEDLDVVIEWLTGFSKSEIASHVDAGTTFREFFAAAHINPAAILITGRICGVVIQEIEDPLMKQIRYLDKLVDEVANGRAMTKILRQPV